MRSNLKKFFSELFNRFKQNTFVKSILTLSAGVVISQALAFCTTPIVSRIYAPEIIGDYSLITSNASIISVFVCLGLMSAIMIPDSDDESKGLCRLITAAVIGLSTVFLIIALALSPRWKAFEVSIDYRIACLILWLYVILTNVSSVCYAYVNRQKMYKALFWNPTLGTATNAVVSIGLGLLNCGLWGYSCGNLLAAVVLIIHMLRKANPFVGKLEQENRMVSLLQKHKRFPLYQMPANFIATFANQLPVQMIKRFFGSAVLGSYSMCLTVLDLPSRFLSAPVNRVYFQEASSRYNKGESIGEFSYKILETNIKIAILPISLLIIFGKPLFVFVLGEKWAQAGSFAAVLGIYQLVLFCSSCLSGNYVIIGKQNINLYFSIAGLTLNVLAFTLGYMCFHEAFPVLICFAVAGSVCNLFDCGLFLYYTGVSVRKYLLFVFTYIILPAAAATIIRIGLIHLGGNL